MKAAQRAAIAQRERVQPRVRARRDHHVFDGSSWVSEAWYTETEQLVEVGFHDGHRHFYFDVVPASWQRFTRSGSPGRFVREILEQHPHRGR